jgi:hypothetical protein
MNGTGFKNKDEMRSAIDTFKAELGRLENWDLEALGELWAWLDVYRIKVELEKNRRYKSWMQE